MENFNLKYHSSSSSHCNDRPCEGLIGNSSVGEERRLRYFLDTETTLLDISRGTALTTLSFICWTTGAFVLRVHKAVILTDQLFITEGTGEADITEAQSVQATGGNAVVAGAHLTEKTAVFATTLAFSIDQAS